MSAFYNLSPDSNDGVFVMTVSIGARHVISHSHTPLSSRGGSGYSRLHDVCVCVCVCVCVHVCVCRSI